MTRQESKAWEEYKDLVLSAKNKFEAVKDEADKEFDQINGPAWGKYKERIKHNKDAAWWEYWHAIFPAINKREKTIVPAWKEYEAEYEIATEKYNAMRWCFLKNAKRELKQ